jgi:hypothetical protein
MEAPSLMTLQSRVLLTSILVLLVSAPCVDAFDPPQPDEPLLTLRFALDGKTEEGLIESAMVQAVRSATGRLYFTEFMLRGRELLSAYVGRHAGNFVPRYNIHSSEIRGGRYFVDIEVVVDVAALYKDLTEKRFLYRPFYRPVFYLFIAETFDGALVTEQVGRTQLLDTLSDRKYRYLWADPPLKANNSDIPASEKTEVLLRDPRPDQDMRADLAAACAKAQRNEVEIFITGRIETTTDRAEKVYFDDYHFVQTHCTLELVRADTGEVLSRYETTTKAGNVDVQQAVRTATTAAVKEVAPNLLEAYDKQWGKTVLGNKQWGNPEFRRSNLVRVMAIGLEDDEVSVLREILAGVSAQAEVYTHSEFADVAVLNVCWDGETAELLNLLRQAQHPGFQIRVQEPDGLILDIM